MFSTNDFSNDNSINKDVKANFSSSSSLGTSVFPKNKMIVNFTNISLQHTHVIYV